MTITPARALLALAAAALAACSSTPITPPATATAQPTAAAPVTASPTPAPRAMPAPTPQSSVATVTLPDYLNPKSAIAMQRSVYFDYDEVALTRDDGPIVERHGKYLAANPRLAIRVEGNTDERGGTEYNLALGQKRAEAVVKALQIYGVRPAQVEAVSWGEGRPRASGHDETAWAQNRRADLQYPAK